MLRGAMRRWVITVAMTVCCSGLASGCRKDQPSVSEPQDPARAAAVEKCQAGIERAVKANTSEEALHVYYADCADVYSKPGCRDAWRAAANGNPSEHRAAIADGCRKAYCPDLTMRALEMCTPNFEVSGPRLDQSWGPFFSAVLENEGAESLTPALLSLFIRLAQLKGSEAAPSASAALGAGALPGASAAPSASAAPGASAAPSASASVPAKKTKAGARH